MDAEVLVVGGGPAGASCAIQCAQGGLKTVLIEKAHFPREKVCGDCLNPNCWPILERLGVAQEILKEPHATAMQVDFLAERETEVHCTFPESEVVIKRSLFDSVLLRRAETSGVTVWEGASLVRLAPGWHAETDRGDQVTARTLVAADGRNSTVNQLLGRHPRTRRDRVAMQTHLPLRPDDLDRIQLRFMDIGYCGIAPVSGAEENVCLVATPDHIGSLRLWAEREFAVDGGVHWRTISPISRAPVRAAERNLFRVGDCARVMEPFTGEGIYYALASGLLAADHILQSRSADQYVAAHRRLYRGRLWINELARLAVLHPRTTSTLLGAPGLGSVLNELTRRVLKRTSSGAGSRGPFPTPP